MLWVRLERALGGSGGGDGQQVNGTSTNLQEERNSEEMVSVYSRTWWQLVGDMAGVSLGFEMGHHDETNGDGEDGLGTGI